MSALPSLPALLEVLHVRGIAVPPGRLRVDGYGDSAELSQLLLGLIRSGRKRAGTSLLWAIEADGETMPAAGDIEIVVDHDGEPALLTRLTQVVARPFGAVDARYAAVEGEGDGSLGEWRRGHWAFFSRECARIGRVPDENMPVVCCEFELLAVVPPAPDARLAPSG